MKKAVYLIFLGSLLLPMACNSVTRPNAQEVTMTAVRIADGDTFEGRNGTGTYKIRLQGIDAPERGQDFSNKSKETLGALLKQGPLKVKLLKKDQYGRWLGDVYNADGAFVNERMVAEGMAWHFRKYSKDKTLERLEKEAREARKGLWSLDNPVAPWDYRKSKKK